MQDFEQLELSFRGMEHMSDTERMILSALHCGATDCASRYLTDEQLERQVFPKKNRLICLLGHLAVAHDKMRILLRMSDRLHPELDIAFFYHPDRSQSHQFSSSNLKKTSTVYRVHAGTSH